MVSEGGADATRGGGRQSSAAGKMTSYTPELKPVPMARRNGSPSPPRTPKGERERAVHSPRRPPGQSEGRSSHSHTHPGASHGKSGGGDLFPPINSRKQKEAPSMPQRYDAVGRRVAPPPAKPAALQNKVNQCALKTLLLSRGYFRNNLYQAPTMGGVDYNQPPPLQATAEHAAGRPSSPKTAEKTVLGAIAKRTGETQSFMDLRGLGVTDAYMVALCSVIASHPTATDLDLAMNPFTESSAKNLLEAISMNRKVLRVDLTGVRVSQETVAAIETMCEDHQKRRIDLEEKRVRRTERRELKKAEKKRRTQITKILEQEREDRNEIREDAHAIAAQELMNFHKTLAWQTRKEERTRLRKMRIAGRYALCEAETDARGVVWRDEELARCALLSPIEATMRGVLVDEQLDVRVKLKKEENGDWVLSKRAEKTRLKQYAQQRADLEAVEEGERAKEVEVYEAAVVQLAEDGEASRMYHADLLQERLDREAAIRRKKQQEEARLEQERQWKKDAEARERARQEMDHARARDKMKRVESSKRQKLEKEEEGDFALVQRIHAVVLDVTKARQAYFNAERALAKELGTAATPTANPGKTSDLLCYIGNHVFTNIVGDTATVDLAFPAQQRLEDLDAKRGKYKGKYVAAAKAAEAALFAHIIEYQPVLLPHCPPPAEIDSKRPPSVPNPPLEPERRGGRRANDVESPTTPALTRTVSLGTFQTMEQEYLERLQDAAKARQAAVFAFEADAQAEVDASLSYDWATITARRQAVVSATVNARVFDGTGGAEAPALDACEFQTVPVQGGGCVPGAKPAVAKGSLIHRFAGDGCVDDVTPFLRAAKYRCTLPGGSWVWGTKRCEIIVVYEAPAVDPAALDDRGRLCRADVFGAATATLETTVHVDIKHRPMLVTVPSGLAELTYVEGTELHKFRLCRKWQMSPYVMWQERPPVQLDSIASKEAYEEGEDPAAASTDGHPKSPLTPASGGNTYAGGKLIIAYAANYSEEDEVFLRRSFQDGDWNPNETGDALLRGGVTLAALSKGSLRDVQKRQESGVPQSFPTYEIDFVDESCTPRFVLELLSRLRFCNVSQGPSTLVRRVHFSLYAPHVATPATVPVHIEFEVDDDPTELVLPHHKLIYRMEGCDGPESLKSHLKPSQLPLFPGVKLVDPDTEYVHCATVRVTATAAQPGDTIWLKGRSSLMYVQDGDVVVYAGSPVGTLKEAGPDVVEVVFGRKGEASLGCIQCLLRCIHFRNESADVPQGRRLFDLAIDLGPSVTHAAQDDDGPVDECPADAEMVTLSDTVEVRAACELFDVQNHWNVEYKEGSGPVRLAPFDIKLDQHAMVDSWSGGHLLVEIVSGGCDDDIVNLRTPHITKDGDYKFVPRKEQVLSRQERMLVGNPKSLTGGAGGADNVSGHEGDDDETLSYMPSQTHVSMHSGLSPSPECLGGSDYQASTATGQVEPLDPVPVQSGANSPAHSDGEGEAGDTGSAAADKPAEGASDGEKSTASAMSASSGSIRDRMRERVQAVVQEKLLQKQQMAGRLAMAATEQGKKALRVADERPTAQEGMKFFDIVSNSRRLATCVLCPAPMNKALVRFVGRGMSRKDVVAICRLVTYANRSSDPTELQKVVRVELRDSGHVSSQAMMQIDVLNVDDVTEIRLENKRRKFRPGMREASKLGCFPLAGGFYRVKLQDPDTEFLDGGSVGCELVGGGLKGDTVGFMTSEQQVLAMADAREYRTGLMEKQRLDESTDTVGVHVADIPETPLDIRDGKKLYDHEDRHIGTIEISNAKAAGCNNLRVAFTKNDPPIVSLPLASYVMSCFTFTTSFENNKLTAGQRVYCLKVLDPENPVEGKEKIMIDVSKPIFYVPGATGEIVVKAKAGEHATLLDKVTAHVGEKPAALMQSGYTQVTIVEGAQEGDVLAIHPGSGSSINVKENSVNLAMEHLGRLSTFGGPRLRLEHSWASRLTAKALVPMLQAIVLKAHTPGRRTVEILVSDGVEPNMEMVRVDVE